MLKYYAEFIPLSRLEDKIPYRLDIRGVALTTETNKNNWKVEEAALPEIAKQLVGKTLRINHSSNVSDVIGRIKKAEPQENKVIFEAEIVGSDPITSAIKEKIMNGLIDRVSIGLDAFEIYCSVCGKLTRKNDEMIHNPKEHGGVEVVKKFDVKELSIVLDPAYEESKFSIAASFTAAMERYLAVTLPGQMAGVTNEPQPEKAGDKKECQEGERMSVVTTPDSAQRESLSLQDLIKYLESIKVSADTLTTKFADIDARLKKLEEAEEARRKAEEAEEARRKAEEAEEAKRKAEEAEEAAEAEEAEEAEDKEKDDRRRLDAQSILAKSKTSNKTETAGIPKWASEIVDSMKRVLG